MAAVATCGPLDGPVVDELWVASCTDEPAEEAPLWLLPAVRDSGGLRCDRCVRRSVRCHGAPPDGLRQGRVAVLWASEASLPAPLRGSAEQWRPLTAAAEVEEMLLSPPASPSSGNKSNMLVEAGLRMFGVIILYLCRPAKAVVLAAPAALPPPGKGRQPVAMQEIDQHITTGFAI